MSSITVVSNVNLASPEGGPPLPFGVPVDVDDTDDFIRNLLDSGMLTRVGDPGNAQAWGEGTDQIDPTGTVHTLTPQPVSGDAGPDGAEIIPTEDSTKDELRSYVDRRGIDVPAGATKAQLLEAIRLSGSPDG